MRTKISPRQTVKGLAFGEYIRTEGLSKRRFEEPRFRSNSLRLIFILICFAVVFCLVLVRLINLTLIKGAYYRNLSDNNRIRTSIIHAPRGVIFDRNGEPLVYNTPGFRITEKDPLSKGTEKTVLLTREEAMKYLAKGANLEIDSLRRYSDSQVTAHVLGYLGQISKEELSSPSYADYHGGDLVGKMGIEQSSESLLRGIDGRKLVEVDALGKTIRVLGQTEPISGHNMTTTLDIHLQKAVFEAMSTVGKGAAIVTTPNGEMLALVSKPTFDPNLFTLGEKYKPASQSAYSDISQILSDNENQPLLNRAIGGTYPPGSTFKIITAASALENNLVDENFQIEDTGVIHVGDFSYSNWYFTQYGKTDGLVNIVSALKRSNDIFFYKLAEKVGVEKLSQTARKFGLGEKSGIDLFGEAKGLVPTKEWKQKTIKEPWYLGDTYHYGIGQGYLLTTPLQVNTWTQVIANGGTLYQQKLIQSAKFNPSTSSRTGAQGAKLLSERTVSLIREGMVESCSEGGVAWPLFKLKIKSGKAGEKLKIDERNFLSIPLASGSADMREVKVACKTGTAQHGGLTTMPHAWITLFAPAYNPQIVVTVLAESSGEGSNVAAPIAKKILEEWLSQ